MCDEELVFQRMCVCMLNDLQEESWPVDGDKRRTNFWVSIKNVVSL